MAEPEPETETATADDTVIEADAESPTETSQSAISWTASEFIAHDKSISWYLGLAVVAILGAGLIYVITRDMVSVTVVIVAAILFGVYGSHQPRQLKYRLDEQSFSVGNKSYSYDDFKSFSVEAEGAFSRVVLLPLKRFALQITLHYPPEDEDRILELLGGRLPFEEPRRDSIENLMRRIRF